MVFGSNQKPPEAQRAGRRPRPVTREWLFRAATHYLGRYASTSENLRAVLARKVAKRERDLATLAAPSDDAPEIDRDAHAVMIGETVARLLELGLLDDAAFAEAKFAGLRRRGTSLRQAEAKLSQKGVERDMIASVIATDETGDAAAARRYAERRRLGPFRLRDRQERRDRDIAALMRAGFSFGDARAAIDGEFDQGDDPRS